MSKELSRAMHGLGACTWNTHHVTHAWLDSFDEHHSTSFLFSEMIYFGCLHSTSMSSTHLTMNH